MSSLTHPLRWLFVDLNSYFASVEQQERPELRGKVVGVAAVLGSEHTGFIAASKEAKQYGIKTGTSVREARAIIENANRIGRSNKFKTSGKGGNDRFEPIELHVVEARPDVYVRYHNDLVDAVESVLPVTSVQSIDEMACRLNGSDRDPENARALALQVKQAIRDQVGDTITCSIGLAPNRFLAKVGSDMQKPDGLTMLRDVDLPNALFKLKPNDFPGIGRQMDKRFKSFGVKTMEDLYNLSIAEMKSIWGGVVGDRFWRWMRGEDLELGESATKTVGHSNVLAPELRHMKGAYEVIQKLTHKAAARLRRYSLWAGGASVWIRFYDHSTWHAKVRFDVTQDTLSLLNILQQTWEKGRNENFSVESDNTADSDTSLRLNVGYSPTRKSRGSGGASAHVPHSVGITFTNLTDASERTLSLFDQTIFGHGERRVNLSKALDKINQKFGGDAAYFGGIHFVKEVAPPRIAFTNIPDIEEFEDMDSE